MSSGGNCLLDAMSETRVYNAYGEILAI